MNTAAPLTSLKSHEASPVKLNGEESFSYDRFDRLLYELRTKTKPFDGERYVPGAGVQICYEHLHRYLFASQFVKPHHTVLDLGCGVGYGTLLLAMQGARVLAVDLDEVSIANLNSLAKDHDLKNISTYVGDIDNSENFFATISASIDIVVCHEVIEHLSEKTQYALLKRLADGSAPFTEHTTVFVSTPDREFYEQARNEPNPFHLKEWNRAEFESMLKANFKHVSLYEQKNGAVNLFSRTDAQRGDVSFFELGWQNNEQLIPKLSPVTHSGAEYMYAVASQEPLPKLPKTSVLVDSSNQYVRERLDIAAHELRLLGQEVRKKRALREEVLREVHEEYKASIEMYKEEARHFEQIVERQGDKIRNLQKETEKQAAHILTMNEHYPPQVKLLNAQVEKLHYEIAKLQPWHAMGGSLLGETPEAAAQVVHYLRTCEAALNSPGHRFVKRCGKLVRAVLPLKYLLRFARFIEALAKA